MIATISLNMSQRELIKAMLSLFTLTGSFVLLKLNTKAFTFANAIVYIC